MYIILFLIIIAISGGYLIYKLSDGNILKYIFHPSQSGRESAKEYLINKEDLKWSMYIDEAIKRLEPYGFIRAEILRMDLNEFISIVDKYIGKVKSVSFEKKETTNAKKTSN